MKNFETILKENNVAMLSKNYPSRQEENDCLEKNPTMKLWERLNDYDQSKLLESFFNQFFTTVKNDIALAIDNETESKYTITLDGKYFFHINLMEENKYFKLYHCNTVRLENNHIEFAEEKPKRINFNLKNVDKLSKLIMDYCSYLNGKNAWDIEQKRLEIEKKDYNENYRTNMFKTLCKEIPNGTVYDNTSEFKVNQALYINIDKEHHSINLSISSYNLSTENLIKVAKFIGTLETK